MKNRKIKAIFLAAATVITASAWITAGVVEADRRDVAPAVSTASNDGAVTGDYVEVRTAAVFAGACHFNGEYVTTGRDVMMAWSFASGSHAGVSLAGVRVIAAVTSDKNLSDASTSRKAEIVVDSSATPEQAKAAVELLKVTCADSLGTVTMVRRGSVSFAHSSNGYAVDASGFGKIDVKPRPDDSCCTQPGDVWYEPLSPIEKRKVGYTAAASFTGELTPAWHRSDENSAFYGAIKF